MIVPVQPPVNPDLERERQNASFDVKELQGWWYGGVEKLELKRRVERDVYGDGGQISHELDYLSHADVYELTLKRTIEAAKKLQKLQQELNPGGNNIWPAFIYDLDGGVPFTHPFLTHITMFLDAIKSQGTPEQIARWAGAAENCSIIGTYAQTEIGHGTNVRGIETTADYDLRADQFVLNTPSLEAYKMWPGGMGHTSNYALVVAQLYIRGAPKGVQLFMVPIRDPETHMPLPGIDVGEIGKKMGMNGINQGFLGLKNVRIPRTNMLMRNARVDRDGTFTHTGSSKIMYIIMVYTRCIIVESMKNLLAQATTIAVRYSAVRRQSPINPGEPEPQILDHVTQQLKLFPQLANVFAYKLCAQNVFEQYARTTKEIEAGDYSSLPEMHTLACVLKVVSTIDAANGIETVRLACGGHGYLAAANLSNIYSKATAACTYDGEVTVLLLQVGRSLVKTWSKLRAGGQIPNDLLYLRMAADERNHFVWDGSWECIATALQLAAANKTRIAYETLSKLLAEGYTQGEAANNSGIELVQAAELHGRQFVAKTFLSEVKDIKRVKRSAALNRVLEHLLELFLVHTALNNMKDILRFITLTDAHVSALQERLKAVLKKLRPDAVAICDGFDIHDAKLNSVLGCYDGKVYERIFKSAKSSPMNQKPVPDAFHKYLKPFLKSNL